MRFCVLLYFLTNLSYLSADVDPFYLKLYAEGKTYFNAGNFQEAEVNFKIAEFGLLDEQKTIKELYLYYSLTLLRLGKADDALGIIKKFETEPGSKDLTAITVPQPIKNQVKAMLTALSLPRRTGEADYWLRIFNLEMLFLETLEQLEANKINAVESNLKKFELSDKNEPRLYYLKGILSFKQQDYKSCIKALKAFEKHKPQAVEAIFLDKLHYYLSLAYHYLENSNQAAIYYNRVKNLDIKSELYRKLTKTAGTQDG
jgi:tetratricopeptide (TPR) repeat protein